MNINGKLLEKLVLTQPHRISLL